MKNLWSEARSAGSSLTKRFTSVKYATLSNGARVVTRHIPGQKMTDLCLMFLAGSREEARGGFPQGTAHFNEHMSFRGSAKLSPGEAGRVIRNLNGSINASTNHDVTSFTISLPAQHIDTGLDVLTDMSCRAIFPENEIERERRIILVEKLVTHDHKVTQRAFWHTTRAAFNSDRARAVIGTDKSIQSIRREHLINFRDRYFLAGNAFIAVEGNIEHDRVMAKLEKDLQLPEGFHELGKPLAYVGGDFRQPESFKGSFVTVAFKGPPETEYCMGGVGQAYKITGRLLSFLLSNELRENKGIVYGLDDLRTTGLEWGLWGVGFEVFLSDVSICLKSVRNALHGLSKNIPVSPFNLIQENDRINHKEQGRHVVRVGAYMMAKDLLVEGLVFPPDYYYHLRQAVTPDDIRRVVRESLSHPPTFVAEGNLGNGEGINLPSPQDIRDMFWPGPRDQAMDRRLALASQGSGKPKVS
jgi:predicted Zn-dependent peptidase